MLIKRFVKNALNVYSKTNNVSVGLPNVDVTLVSRRNTIIMHYVSFKQKSILWPGYNNLV